MIEQFRGFAFPLNVYAYMLHLEWGKVDYLHFGLFAPGEDDLARAQERSTALVLERLPAAPARILDVGIGLGTTLAALVRLRHDVTGITPDAHQVQVAQERFGIGSRIVCSRWEDFEPGPRHYALVLFQESAQYIAPQDIFARAHEWLAPGGTLQIQDEVGLRRGNPGEPWLNLLSDYLSAASAHGLVLTEQVDLSAQAAPTPIYILNLVEKHRPSLQRDLGGSHEQIDALNQSTHLYKQKYGDGRYGYALLRFRNGPGAR